MLQFRIDSDTMSANKHIERVAKEALGIEIGRGKRVPKDRMKEFEAKVAELKVTIQPIDLAFHCSSYALQRFDCREPRPTSEYAL